MPSGALPFDFGRTLLSGTWVPNTQVPERVTAAHQASYVSTRALSENPGPRVFGPASRDLGPQTSQGLARQHDPAEGEPVVQVGQRLRDLAEYVAVCD